MSSTGIPTFTLSQSDISSLASKFDNTTVLITGGSGGIGLSTALLLHTLSSTVNIAVLDRSAPVPSAPTSLTTSPRFLHIPCDITSWSSQRAAFSRAATHFPTRNGIDHVFVNAGVNEYKDQFFSDALDQDGQLAEPDRRTIDIDLRAAADTVKLAIWWLRKNQDAGKNLRGSIVMTASLAGYLASAGAPMYSAAKHGIVGLMRALKNDLATLNIAISVVGPGITLTDLVSGRKPGQSLKEWAIDMRKRGVPINDPEEVAAVVVWLMGQGMKGNGKGVLVQAGKYADVEAGIAKSRNVWMGQEMLELFRGGRNAPLFPNKL